MIDGGANIGKYSLLIQDTNPQTTTYAFEPVKETCEILTKNDLFGVNDLDITNFDKYFGLVKPTQLLSVIHSNIKKYSFDKTLIIISHRKIETIDFDNVFEIDGNKIRKK